MAEFAMVLPMLALMTFGTIEVAIWMQQQSSLNAAAFLAARSATVLGGEAGKTKEALADYTAASPAWLSRSVDSMKLPRGTANVTLDASADRFTGLISSLTGGDVNGFDRLGAAAALPLEYEPRRHANAKTGPKSRFLVDYRVEKTEKVLASAAVSGAKAAVKGVQDDVKWVLDQVNKYIASVPKPTPAKPGSGTTKPGGGTSKPGGGTGGKKPVSKPGGGGTGGTPVVTLSPPPAVGAILALKPEGEAFSTRGAVMSNPHDHGKKNSGSLSSLFYLSPDFEAKGVKNPTKTAWCAKNVVEGLAAQEKNVGEKGTANLHDTCVLLNKYLQTAKKTPQLAPVVAGFEKRAGAWVKGLTTGLGKEYDVKKKNEERLFGR